LFAVADVTISFLFIFPAGHQDRLTTCFLIIFCNGF